MLQNIWGAVNEDQFNDFIIEILLQHLNPYPMDQSVLILDNVKFHKNEIFEQIIDQIGCIIFYLPRYYPKYNLAEYSFRDVKKIEAHKNVYGDLEGMLSLIDSIEKIKNKNYSKILKDIVYIK